MKKNILALAALATMVWGCSTSDDEAPTPSEPTSQGILQGMELRPTTWLAVNYDLYESLMFVDVVLQDTLQPYASQADMMCATVDGEVRGVAPEPTNEGGLWMFHMTVGSNESNVPVALSYYSDSLKRIFTVDEWTTFDANRAPTGEGAVYVPVFYPVD